MRSCILLTLVAWAWPFAAAAQVVDTTSNMLGSMEPLVSVSSMAIRLALTLGAILAVIFVALWIFKRFMARRWPGAVADRPIRVLDRIHLAPKRTLDVVAVGDRVILLGVTESGINFLTELSAEEKGQLSPTAPPTPGFKRFLVEAKERMRHSFNQARAGLPTSAPSANVRAESS